MCPTHLRSSTQVARKKYHCDACGDSIHQGDRYDVEVYAEPGDSVWSLRLHRRCAEVLRIGVEIWDIRYGESYDPAALYEETTPEMVAEYKAERDRENGLFDE